MLPPERTMGGLSVIAHLLSEARTDPVKAIDNVTKAYDIASTLSKAPYSSSVTYLPGLSLPATHIVRVTGIPAVAASTSSVSVPVQINTPGIIVGIHVATQPANSDAEHAFMGFQLNLEQTWWFTTNGQQATSSPSANVSSPFSICSGVTPWFATVIPARGSGNWGVVFTNEASSGDPITPVMALAFLAGRRWYEEFTGQTMGANG